MTCPGRVFLSLPNSFEPNWATVARCAVGLLFPLLFIFAGWTQRGGSPSVDTALLAAGGPALVAHGLFAYLRLGRGMQLGNQCSIMLCSACLTVATFAVTKLDLAVELKLAIMACFMYPVADRVRATCLAFVSGKSWWHHYEGKPIVKAS